MYDSAKALRYGHLMIMTDQDHDGSHIKGLIMNFLHHFYPSLLKVGGFLLEFITPIVKVQRGHCLLFYHINVYPLTLQQQSAVSGARCTPDLPLIVSKGVMPQFLHILKLCRCTIARKHPDALEVVSLLKPVS